MKEISKNKLLNNVINLGTFLEKKINPNKWHTYSDEQIIIELTKIKGIGRWTAEMFLIFNLCMKDQKN